MPRPISARRYAQAIFRLAVEYDELEKHVVELANLFNEAVGGIQLLDEETESPVEQIASTTPRRRSRRKRGTELTLDD